MIRFVLAALIVFLNGCNPFFIFKPPSLTKLSKMHGDAGNVHVAIDNYGVPFIKADTIDQLMYGLGFMHARDRLFQIDLMRHAALGRVGELFGERGLVFDRKLRILTYRLDEQLARLSPEENQLLDSYVKGVNDGAKFRGRTAEHFLLGIQFEPYTKRDVIAIARLQSWQLAADLFAEITRLKIMRSDWSHEAKMEMLATMDDRRSAIIGGQEKVAQEEKPKLPAYLSKAKSHRHKAAKIEHEDMVQVGGGGSNAWAVDASKSKDGYAMVMNDPHLLHAWPSNFYLATLSAGQYFVTGASVTGLPGIIIGSTKHIAWGVTAALLNTQDAVLLSTDKNDMNSYIVDNVRVPFVDWPQRFCVNKKGKCTDEVHKVSMFGPVIDRKYDKWINKGDLFAVQWTGFHVEEHTGLSAGFVNLAKAKNVSDAVKAIKTISLPGVNLVLGDVEGNIAYAYAGLVPKRDLAQNPRLPLDGSLSSSRWAGFSDMELKPSIIGPSAGYLVTANQNIFGRHADIDLDFGKIGAPPYRALRIKERIDGSLQKNGLVDFDELSTVQTDSTSLEAREIAPLLGSMCLNQFKNKDGSRLKFATAIANFDGRYSTDSIGALPYENLIWEIVSLRLKAALGKVIPDTITYTGQATYLVKTALINELRGQSSAILAKPIGKFATLNDFVGQACEKAYKRTTKKAGTSAWTWRWGRHHYLQRQSLLAKAPVIGGFFRDRKREIAGVNNSPMAEAGLPVSYGANVRFLVKLSNPPEVRAVLDSGNSGTVGHKNAFDQAELWHEGKSILLEPDWEQALKKSVATFKLNPHP